MFPVALKAAGAAVAGAIVVLAVAAGSTGGLPAGAGWAAAAGAFACVSGLVVGTGGRRAPAAGFAVAAVAALVIAPTGGDEVRAAPRVLAMKAPAEAEPAREAAPRGASPTGAESAEPRADGGNPTGATTAEPEIPPETAPETATETDAATLVRAYYADLDARRYTAAWKRLSPAVQQRFGDFATWRDGYGTTVGHAVEDLRADAATASHVLVASCGSSGGRYRVSWRFDAGKAVEVSAEALSGTAC